MKTITIRTAALILVLSLSLVQIDGGWLWNPANADGARSTSQPGVHILDSDDTGIVLELYTPDFQIEPLATEELTCDRLSVTDYATHDQAGWPALPVRGAMLGIPPDANVTLTVLSTDAEILPARYDLCPVATPIVETEPSGESRFRGYQLVRDPQAYASNSLSPVSAAELVETGFIRSQRVAQIRFHPFQYNPTSGEVRHLERIQVRLDFNQDSSALDATIGFINEGAFEESLSHTLLNYDAARGWRTQPTSLDRQDQIDWPLPAQTEPSYKIMVDEDGIYEVSYADLQAAGITTATLDSLDPRTFQLHNQGQEVAIYVEGETDGSFNQADYILFYGQKMNTKYTNTNVYWLTWGDENGARMSTVDGTPTGTATSPQYFLTTHRLEEDHWYQSKRPSGPDNDHWYWNSILAYGTPFTQSYTFTLNHIATAPLSTTVRGLLKGVSSATSQHHTQVYLNGNLIDDAIWTTEEEHSFEITTTQSYLNEGLNTISIVIPLDIGGSPPWEFMWVNWFEIDYCATYIAEDNLLDFDGDDPGNWEFRIGGFSTSTLEAFNITSPTIPIRILSPTIESASGAYTFTFEHTLTTENHYIALSSQNRINPLGIEKDSPSTLYDTANGADYIFITHADFYTDVLPLANYRASQGLRTVIVDVQDVYDEFGYGIFDPEAIRAFLAHAYTNWVKPAPTYVLLVGDGNYDFKDNGEHGEPNYIPPYLLDIDPEMSETAADNRYVCVSGEDVLPDMHLGRLPVKTSVEASTIITKTLSYEQNPPGDDADWNKQVLFVADNPDTAGDFYAYSDAIADHYLPSPYVPQKVYYGDTHPDSEEARAAIIGAINDGRLIVNYIGHASIQFWGSPRLLELSDIAALTNTQRLPLIVPMTCLEGYFIRPSSPSQDASSLGESIVLAPGGGAVASWSPSGYGYAAGHDYLNKGLFEAFFFDGVAQLGPATTQGKLYLYSHTGLYRDSLDTFILFGDPALALAVLKADVGLTQTVTSIQPVNRGDTITYTLTYSNTGPGTAHHVTITDTLPATIFTQTVTSSGATITPRPGSRFVWDVEDLAAGEGGIITITAQISPTLITGTVVNTATITATSVEISMDNNISSSTVTVMPLYLYYLPIVNKDADWLQRSSHSVR